MVITTDCGGECVSKKANGITRHLGGLISVKLSSSQISGSVYLGTRNRTTQNSMARVLIHEAFGHGFAGLGNGAADHQTVRFYMNSINSEINSSFIHESPLHVVNQGYN